MFMLRNIRGPSWIDWNEVEAALLCCFVWACYVAFSVHELPYATVASGWRLCHGHQGKSHFMCAGGPNSGSPYTRSESRTGNTAVITVVPQASS